MSLLSPPFTVKEHYNTNSKPYQQGRQACRILQTAVKVKQVPHLLQDEHTQATTTEFTLTEPPLDNCLVTLASILSMNLPQTGQFGALTFPNGI